MSETQLHVPETMHIETPLPEPDAPQERELSPREKAMAAIVERRAEAYAKELDYGEELADDARALSGHVEPPAPYPEPKPAPIAATPAPEPPPPVDGDFVDVGGQRYRVTKDQLRQLAATGAIALHAVQQPQPQHQAVQPAPRVPEPPQRTGPLLTPDEAKALATRVQYGSESDVQGAIVELADTIAARTRAQQIDPRQIEQRVHGQLRQQMLLEQNLNTIGGEFPEIFNDHTLSQLAALKLHEVRQRDAMLGITKPDLVAYREACQEVRRYMPPPAVQPQPAQVPSPQSQAAPAAANGNEQRLERKRGAPRQPTPTSRSAPGDNGPPRPPTGSEIVAAMRQSRGQQSYA